MVPSEFSEDNKPFTIIWLKQILIIWQQAVLHNKQWFRLSQIVQFNVNILALTSQCRVTLWRCVTSNWVQKGGVVCYLSEGPTNFSIWEMNKQQN